MTMAHLCGHDCEPMCGNEADRLKRQLASARAQEEQLREALKAIADVEVDVDAKGVREIADIVIAALAAARDGSEASFGTEGSYPEGQKDLSFTDEGGTR